MQEALSFTLDENGAPLDAVLERIGAESFPLRSGRVVVGRATLAQVVIARSYLSRAHFELVFSPGSVVIADLGSSGGTFVNGERLRGPRVLRVGDTIQASDCDFRLVRAA